MSRVDALAVAGVLCLSSASFATAPEPLPLVPSAVETASPPLRSARLLPEALSAAGVGLIAPVVGYLAITQGRTFQSFFAAVTASTLIGWVVAPLAVALVHRWLGGEGGAWRLVLGTLCGLAVGLLAGGTLATMPNQGYVAGLGLLWTMPSVGALTALEWGRGSPAR